MRKLLSLIMILGLGFSACKKEENIRNNSDDKELSEDFLTIRGKKYEIQYLKKAISFLVNMPVDELIYDPIQKVFLHGFYTGRIDPFYEIDDIIKLEEAGYEF